MLWGKMLVLSTSATIPCNYFPPEITAIAGVNTVKRRRIVSVITGEQKTTFSAERLGPFSLIIILLSVPGRHLPPRLGGRLFIVSAEN